MKFDDLLTNHLGDFGKYQQVIYLLACLPPVWCAIIIYSWTFTGASLDYRCRLDATDLAYSYDRNGTNASQWLYEQSGKCARIQKSTYKVQPCVDYVFDHSEIVSSALEDVRLH